MLCVHWGGTKRPAKATFTWSIYMHTLRWACNWKKKTWMLIFRQIWQDVNSWNCLYLFRRNPIFYYTITKVGSWYWTRKLPYILNQGSVWETLRPYIVTWSPIWTIWTDRDFFFMIWHICIPITARPLLTLWEDTTQTTDKCRNNLKQPCLLTRYCEEF